MGWGNSGSEYAGWDMARTNQNPFYNPYMSHVDWGGGVAAIYGLMKQKQDEDFQKQQILGQQAFERQKWQAQEDREKQILPYRLKEMDAVTRATQEKIDSPATPFKINLLKSWAQKAGESPAVMSQWDKTPPTDSEADEALKNYFSTASANAQAKATADRQAMIDNMRFRHQTITGRIAALGKTAQDALAEDNKNFRSVQNDIMARPQDKQAAMQRVMMDKAYIAKMTHAGSQLVGAPGGVADAGTLAALEKMADETEQYFGSQAPAPEQPGILQQIGGALGSLFGGGGQQQAPPSAAQKAPAQGAPAQSKVVTPVVGKSGKEDKIPPAVLDAARKKRPDLTDAEIIELWKQNSKKTT